MANWDRDFDEDFDGPDDPREHRPRRNLYGRAQAKPTKPVRMWNGKDVEQMESDHILNSILFCEKRFAEAKTNFEKCFPDSVNAFYFESPFQMFPDYTNLRDEWDNRNS